MKILHITHHFHPCIGGIESAVEGLCRGLIERGHQSDVACLDTCSRGGKKLPAFEEYKKIKIFRLPYLDLKIYKIAPGILNLVKDYDIVHVHGVNFFSDFLGVAKPLHKKPLVLNTHGGFFHTKQIMWLKRLYLLWNVLPLRFFEKVIADSRSDETIFSKISSNIEHIPNGIPSDVFQVSRSPKPYTLLYVGRISKNKRIDLLIETLTELLMVYPEIKLKVVGEDWEGMRKELETLVEENGVGESVEFLGKVSREELLDNLSQAAFFVSASGYEGFGISVLEAMAAGCPCIVSDIPAFREFIEDGKNGFIVDFSNPKGAAERILSLFEAELSEVASAGKKTSSGYGWEGIVVKVEDIYKNILQK